MSLSMRITGTEALERKVAPRLLDPPIHRFLLRSGITLQSEMRRRVRVDTGHGRRSIAYEVERRRVRAGTNLDYLEVMARGRRPGRRMPPQGALLGWMRRHGIPANREYPLRRAIGRHGIRGDDFDVKAFEASIPQIRGHVALLGRELEAAMGAA